MSDSAQVFYCCKSFANTWSTTWAIVMTIHSSSSSHHHPSSSQFKWSELDKQLCALSDKSSSRRNREYDLTCCCACKRNLGIIVSWLRFSKWQHWGWGASETRTGQVPLETTERHRLSLQKSSFGNEVTKDSFQTVSCSSQESFL